MEVERSYGYMTLNVAAFYHFAPLGDPASLRGPLLDLANNLEVCGSILLASEGINGTIAGPKSGVDKMLARLRAIPGFGKLEHKESSAATPPFRRMKVKLKREIVTMGQPLTDPRNIVGRYVDAKDWNAFVESEDVVVIDTRNDYEVGIGSFEGAIDPGIESFRQFPGWWEKNKSRFGNKKIAMFCTGGIRCEKSTSFARAGGFEEVYHLKGGILKYLEEVEEEHSLWNGECYVFDGRVSLAHGLKEGRYQSCFACGKPISSEDRAHPDFEKGVSCPGCIGQYDDARKARFRERQKQINLSLARGERPGFVG